MVRISAIALALLLGRTSLSAQFQENLGQSQSGTKFLIKTSGAIVRATETGLEFSSDGAAPKSLFVEGAAGAWTGEDPQPESISYRIGADPKKWVSRARLYGKLRWTNVIPGVDWILYQKGSHIEYDFELNSSNLLPRLVLHSNFDLSMQDGELTPTEAVPGWRQKQPKIFAGLNPMSQEIPGHVHLLSRRSFRFAIETTKYAGPLRIDPIVELAGRFGGPEDDRIVAANASGALGVTRSGAWDLSPNGTGLDIFLRAYEGGNRYHTIFWGGSGDEILNNAEATVTDSTDRMIAVGSTSSRDLPTSISYSNVTAYTFGGGDTDGLIVYTSGATLGAETISGPESENLFAVSSATGTTFVGGEIRSAGQQEPDGILYMRGGNYNHTWRFPGAYRDALRSLAWVPGTPVYNSFYPPGTLYFAGNTNSDDFVAKNSPWSRRASGTDVWLGAIQVYPEERQPPELLWQGVWGGPADELTTSIQFLPGLGPYLVGNTNSNNLELTEPFQSNYGGGDWDGFLLQVQPNGARILRSTYLGASGADRITSAQSYMGELLIAGSTDSRDWSFPGSPIQENALPEGHGATDAFTAMISFKGALEWGARFGDAGDDVATFVNANRSGIWLAGTSSSLTWLPYLHPALTLQPSGSPIGESHSSAGGLDSWAIRFRTNILGITPKEIGRNLRTSLPVSSLVEPAFNGLLEVESTNPDLVLVAAGPKDQPLLKTVLHDAATATSAFSPPLLWITSVGEIGETELVLRASGMPERRFLVRVVPSAIYANELTARQSTNYVRPYSAFFAPLAAVGSQPDPQSLRQGLDPHLHFESSDPSALVPLGVTVSPDSQERTLVSQNFDLRRAGTYTLTPRSPHFPTAPGQQIQVVDDATTILPQSVAPLYIPSRLTWVVPVPSNRPSGVISARVEDPSLVLLSTNANVVGASSFTYTESFPFYGLFGQTLGTSGRTRIILSHANGWSFIQEVIIVPATYSVSLWPLQPYAGEQLRLSVRFSGAMPADPIPGASLAGFSSNPTIPLLQSSLSFSVSQPSLATPVETGASNFVFYQVFTASSAANLEFRFQAPEGILPLGSDKLSVTVKPAVFRGLQPEILLPRHGERHLPVIAQIPEAARKQIQVEFRPAGVAVLRQARFDSDTEINLMDYRPVNLIALGSVGSRTTMILTSGNFRLEVPIRIVPFTLVSQFEETRIDQSGALIYSLLPATPNAAFGMDEFRFSLSTEFQTSSSNPDVCTAPDKLPLQGYGRFIPVTCKQPGIADITLQPLLPASEGSGATFRVNCNPNPLLDVLPRENISSEIPNRIITGQGLQLPIALELRALGAAPVSAESLDPSLILLSRNSSTLGAARVEGQASQGSSSVLFVQAQGKTGSTAIRITAANGRFRDIPVYVWPTSVIFDSNRYQRSLDPRQSLIPTSNFPINHSLALAITPVDPITHAPYSALQAYFQLNPDRPPSLLRINSSNSSIAELIPPTPVLGIGSSFPGSSGFSAVFALKSFGSALQEIEQPEGFTASPASRLIIDVLQPRLGLTSPLVLAKGIQRLVYPTALSQNGGAAPSEITITSTNPDALRLASSPDGSGGSELRWKPGMPVYVRCLSELPGGIRLEASGLETQTVPAQFEPVRLVWESANLPNATPKYDVGLSVKLEFLNASARQIGGNIFFSPEAELRLRLRSSDETVLIPESSGDALINLSSHYAYFRAKSGVPGQSILSVELVSGDIAVPEPKPFNVVPWTFSFPSRVSIGRGLAILNFSLNSYASRNFNLGVTPLSGLKAGQSLDTLSVSPFEILQTPSRLMVLTVSAPLNPSQASGSIHWSAEYTQSAETQFDFVTPRFRFNPVGGTNLVVDLSRGSLDLSVDVSALGAYDAAFLAPDTPAQTLRFSSSNPQVASFASPTMQFPSGASKITPQIRILGRGTAVLSLETPPGFNTGEAKQEILITVR